MSFEPSWKAKPATWALTRDAARKNRKNPTSAEIALWDILRSRRSLGLKFRRQHAIGPYLADFYCAAAHLVVEVDGPIHEQQAESDAARTAFLETMGLHVLRFSNEQVLEDPEGVISAIAACIQDSNPSSET